MPIKQGIDAKGNYYVWGTHGKRYYFKTLRGQQIAYCKASQQGKAVELSTLRAQGRIPKRRTLR